MTEHGLAVSRQDWPLFPKEGTQRSKKNYMGKTVQIFLPIQIKGATLNYIFSFTIHDIRLVGK